MTAKCSGYRGEVQRWQRFICYKAFLLQHISPENYLKPSFYLCNNRKMQSESDSDNEFFDAPDKLSLSGSFITDTGG